jgi:hypothetical protein
LVISTQKLAAPNIMISTVNLCDPGINLKINHMFCMHNGLKIRSFVPRDKQVLVNHVHQVHIAQAVKSRLKQKMLLTRVVSLYVLKTLILILVVLAMMVVISPARQV